MPAGPEPNMAKTSTEQSSPSRITGALGWIVRLFIRLGKWALFVSVSGVLGAFSWDCLTNGCKHALSQVPESFKQSLPPDWIHSYQMPNRWTIQVPTRFRFNEASQLFASYQAEFDKEGRHLAFEPRSLALTRICRPYKVETLSVAATFRDFMKEFDGCFRLDNPDGEIVTIWPQTSAPEIEEPVSGLFYCRCPAEVIWASQRPPLDEELLQMLPF